jgi:glucose dehydrogenase
MQRKDYAATAYSELSQITAAHVKHLKAALTFSSGVLRGHEGAPWWSAPQGDNKWSLTVLMSLASC